MMQSHYKHIFFDLDRTLWDFDKNSLETFTDIHLKYQLDDRGVPSFHDFMSVYHTINLDLWDHYRKGEIKKEVLSVKRFTMTLDRFGIDDEALGENMAHDYITISPTKNHLFPDTHKILEYLCTKYRLHIITNGFEEVQHVKLVNAGLDKYFTQVITSEDAGFKKPDIHIFKYAFSVAGALPEESLMIGDDVDVDIAGAREAGMDQVLVDFDHLYDNTVATYVVNELHELMKLL